MSRFKANSSLPNSESKKLLNRLLKKIEEVDFRQLIIDRGGTTDRISNKQYQVCAIDHLLKIAKENRWGLTCSSEFIFIYNGEYWVKVDNDEFQMFLGKAAAKMGVPIIEAKYYLFQEQLMKQFFAIAHLSSYTRDRNRVLVNLKNGTFEVSQEGNSLKDFDRQDFLTYQLPFSYRPDATAPMFKAYLDQVLPEKELQNVLAEYMGYVFARELKLEKCLLLYGSGANGKSVFFEIACALLGEENVSNFSLSNLAQENNRPFIANKLLNYGSEIRANIESDIFKQLVSGEPIQARLKHGNSIVIKDYARLMFNCNELPPNVEHSEAYFRRFLIVPFNVTIPENERNPELAKSIIENELSGVFNWVIAGVDRLIKNKGFTQSETVSNSIKQYKQESDSVYLFMTEGVYGKSDKFNLLKFIYDDYKVVCKDNGCMPLNKRNFQKRLERLGYTSSRRGSGVGYFIGRTSQW